MGPDIGEYVYARQSVELYILIKLYMLVQLDLRTSHKVQRAKFVTLSIERLSDMIFVFLKDKVITNFTQLACQFFRFSLHYFQE